jgi:hypothetical protein
MTVVLAIPQIVQEKLDAFEALKPEFAQCFQFVQNVHGQQRFTVFSVAEVVYYLHARWICECKSLLLSVPHSLKGNEGRLCLQLLLSWQQGDHASVVEYLQKRLDTLPLAQITRQIQEILQRQEEALAQRLVRGRQVLLNRGFNLMQMLDALFAFPEQELLQIVRTDCARFGHRPEQIVQQLEQLKEPIYSYVPHQALAQRNMLVMNMLGILVNGQEDDQPGHRSSRVQRPTISPGPYAEQIIVGYRELTSPLHNNLNAHRFVDLPEHDGTGVI